MCVIYNNLNLVGTMEQDTYVLTLTRVSSVPTFLKIRNKVGT